MDELRIEQLKMKVVATSFHVRGFVPHFIRATLKKRPVKVSHFSSDAGDTLQLAVLPTPCGGPVLCGARGLCEPLIVEEIRSQCRFCRPISRQRHLGIRT